MDSLELDTLDLGPAEQPPPQPRAGGRLFVSRRRDRQDYDEMHIWGGGATASTDAWGGGYTTSAEAWGGGRRESRGQCGGQNGWERRREERGQYGGGDRERYGDRKLCGRDGDQNAGWTRGNHGQRIRSRYGQNEERDEAVRENGRGDLHERPEGELGQRINPFRFCPFQGQF